MLTWQHFKLASIWNLKHLIVSQWQVMLLVVVVVDDLVPVVYLVAIWIAPAHEGLELGNWNASIIKALAEACGCNEARNRKQYKVMRESR